MLKKAEAVALMVLLPQHAQVPGFIPQCCKKKQASKETNISVDQAQKDKHHSVLLYVEAEESHPECEEVMARGWKK